MPYCLQSMPTAAAKNKTAIAGHQQNTSHMRCKTHRMGLLQRTDVTVGTTHKILASWSSEQQMLHSRPCMSVQSSTGVGGRGTQMNQTAQPPYAGMHSICPACKMKNTLLHSKHCCWHLCLFACSSQGFARLPPQQAQLALLHTAATLLAATSKSLSVLHYAVLTTSAVYVYRCPSAHPWHAGHTDHTHTVCSY